MMYHENTLHKKLLCLPHIQHIIILLRSIILSQKDILRLGTGWPVQESTKPKPNQISFVEISREIISTAILFLIPPIQVQHLISAERMQKAAVQWTCNWAATWQNQQSECAPREDSDQPGHPPNLIRVFAVWMSRLIWIFAGRTLILLVLSCCGSYVAISNNHNGPEEQKYT